MAKAAPVQDANETNEVKNVQIFCNGNKFAAPRHVVVNTRHIRSFGIFLDELTRILNPLQGAIRRLYTPVNGNPVEDTKELQEGGGYVAAGKEKFKRLNYFEIQPISPRRTKGPKFPYFDIKPVTHSQFRVSGKVKKINIQSKKIVVFPNGQYFLPPSIIVLNQTEQTSMDTVMHSVGIKVDLPQGGFPERLYTLDGDRIDNAEKVTNGTMYVAASHREKFKPGPYGPYMRMGPLKFPSRLTPINRKKYEAKGSDSEQSQENSTSSEYSSSKRSRKSRAAVRENENGVFHVRQVRRKKSPEKAPAKQPDYDRDQGGVFKAKERNPETRHANVVPENADTKVEKPVDNIAAQQIKEEKLSGGKDPHSKNTPIKKAEKDHKKNKEASGNHSSKDAKDGDNSLGNKNNGDNTANNGESAKELISERPSSGDRAGNSTPTPLSKDTDKTNTIGHADEEKEAKPAQATDEPNVVDNNSEKPLADPHVNTLTTSTPEPISSHDESNKQSEGDNSLPEALKPLDSSNGEVSKNDDQAENLPVETTDSRAEPTKAEDQRISEDHPTSKEGTPPMSEPNPVEKEPLESSVSAADGVDDGRGSSLSNKSLNNDDQLEKLPESDRMSIATPSSQNELDNSNSQDFVGTAVDKSNSKDEDKLDKPSDQREQDVLASQPIESSVDAERPPSAQSPGLSESLTSDQLNDEKNNKPEDTANDLQNDNANHPNGSQDTNNVTDVQQN